MKLLGGRRGEPIFGFTSWSQWRKWKTTDKMHPRLPTMWVLRNMNVEGLISSQYLDPATWQQGKITVERMLCLHQMDRIHVQWSHNTKPSTTHYSNTLSLLLPQFSGSRTEHASLLDSMFCKVRCYFKNQIFWFVSKNMFSAQSWYFLPVGVSHSWPRFTKISTS